MACDKYYLLVDLDPQVLNSKSPILPPAIPPSPQYGPNKAYILRVIRISCLGLLFFLGGGGCMAGGGTGFSYQSQLVCMSSLSSPLGPNRLSQAFVEAGADITFLEAAKSGLGLRNRRGEAVV